MDENKQPGILFVAVAVTQLHFEMKGAVPSPIPVGLAFDYSREIIEESNLLISNLHCDVFGSTPAESKPDIEFTFTIQGVFKGKEGGMPLKEFAEGFAPACLFPYARELISNITSQSPLPTLRIGPVNVNAVMKDRKASLTVALEKKESVILE